MEFVVPRRMGGTIMDMDTDSTFDEDATVVVCSGEVVEQVLEKEHICELLIRHLLIVSL
jgi:transcription initiation factor TFIID subunit 2